MLFKTPKVEKLSINVCQSAGFEITIGLDFDSNAATTYQANFPEALFFNDDIRKVDEKILAKAFKEKNREKEKEAFKIAEEKIKKYRIFLYWRV